MTATYKAEIGEKADIPDVRDDPLPMQVAKLQDTWKTLYP